MTPYAMIKRKHANIFMFRAKETKTKS